jgi:hypothetical protein
MPGSQNVGYGNVIYDSIIALTSAGNAVPGTITWSATTVAANTTSELTANIPGLQVGDNLQMSLSGAAMTTGLIIANVRVNAAGLLAVTWINTTGSPVTVPTTGWNAEVVRPAGALPPNFV